MSNDPIVDEVREIREQLAAEHDFDVRRILEHARSHQALDGRRVISLQEFREQRRVASERAGRAAPHSDYS